MLAAAIQHASVSPAQIHYERHRPETTVLYRIIQENVEGFYCQVDVETGHALPDFVMKEFDGYLACGILAHGFLRAKCEECSHEKLIAFSCTGAVVADPVALPVGVSS